MENLRNLFIREGVAGLEAGTVDDKVLLYLYCYYHYFKADESKLADVASGALFNRSNGNLIDGIFLDDSSDDNTMEFLCCRYYKDEKEFGVDYPHIMAILRTMAATVSNMRKKDFAVDKVVYDRYDELRSSKDETNRYVIRFITNFDPKAEQKRLIRKEISSMDTELGDLVSFEVLFGSDLLQEIEDIENPKEFVSNASIEIEEPNSILFHGKEKSFLTSISARSLHNLFNLYGTSGLFAMNLRYYIKSAKIDDFITDTIQRRGDMFWYFNNGLIIACDDYQLKGTTLTLYNFSIVNGGQTTKLIGSTEFDQDFFIPCKIIKNMYDSPNDRIEFVAGVAEASNTQKPIKAKDLIANRPEQRKLKLQLKKADVFVSIKRGDLPNKRIYSKPWQITSNDELAQFIYSFMYQHPGVARNSKSKLIYDEKIYSRLFGTEYSDDFLKDCLYIKTYYSDYQKKIIKEGTTDPYKIGILKNSLFFMTALIGFVSKFYFNPSLAEAVAENRTNSERIRFFISQKDIDHKIFKEKEAFLRQPLFDLFEVLYGLYLSPAYQNYKADNEYNVYSNFTKVDQNYFSHVLTLALYTLGRGFPAELEEVLKRIMHKQTSEESNRVRDNFATRYIPGLEDQLREYRKMKAKQEKIRPYDVFSDDQLNQIMTIMPSNMFDISQIKRITEHQASTYGPDIIAIIKNADQGK